MKPRVLMWVQTRLGLGHFARAMTICGSLAEQGFAVALAHGGAPIPSLPMPKDVVYVQLPIAHAPNLESSEILDEEGRPIDETWRAKRIVILKAAITEFKPDVFLTESFPLGRWLFAFELVPVLEWLGSLPVPPLVAASVRDIVTRPSKPKKIEAMMALARNLYDLILCHSDETIVRLNDTFPETQALADRIVHTGYTVKAFSRTAGERSGVIVAAGGGRVGGKLFGVAIEAKRIWKQDIGSWTLVAGPLYGDAALERLRNQAPKGIEILGASNALPSLYRSAALVVSQGGYNTVCEALSQGARLTVVPYSTEKETEQSLRAERFAALGLLTSIEEQKLNATSLVEAMERALLRPPSDTRIDFGGAARTTQSLRQLVMERRT